MKSRHVFLKRSTTEVLLGLLVVLLLGAHVTVPCPSVCSCGPSDREVDCSWRGLKQLPDGLPHNLRSLNLSHNHLHNLDGQLSAYAHLRNLDLSHNRLGHVPTGLPRSLWQLHAAGNRIQVLDKNDTAYQWNLRILDLSNNKLERAVFINNTLIKLRVLDLSHNNFWTVPTNMPMYLDMVDLSHNTLVQILPGSLERLPQLSHFYLHANRFSTLPLATFDKLSGLRVITLGDNPWACHLHTEMTYLLHWIHHTPARVLGCPCHTKPVCGETRSGRTGGWHFASYNLPPLAANAHDLSSAPPDTDPTFWWYMSGSPRLSTHNVVGEGSNPHHHHHHHHPPTSTPFSFSAVPRSTGDGGLSNAVSASSVDPVFLTFVTVKPLITDTSATADTTSSSSTATTDTTQATAPLSTKRTTTLRTRSVRRPNQSFPSGAHSHNSSPVLYLSENLWLLWCLALQQVL